MNNWKEHSELELLTLLKEEIIRVGLEDNPNKTDYQRLYDNSRTPSPNTYINKIGKPWVEIVTMIGLKYDVAEKKSAAGKKNKGKIFNSKWKMTDEEFMEMMIQFVKKYDIRTSTDFAEKRSNLRKKEIPSIGTVAKRYGSWKNFWKEMQEELSWRD